MIFLFILSYCFKKLMIKKKSLQNYKSYIWQNIDLNYQELYFYDEFQWVMDRKEMKVDKVYSSTKAAILHDQKV